MIDLIIFQHLRVSNSVETEDIRPSKVPEIQGKDSIDVSTEFPTNMEKVNKQS